MVNKRTLVILEIFNIEIIVNKRTLIILELQKLNKCLNIKYRNVFDKLKFSDFIGE